MALQRKSGKSEAEESGAENTEVSKSTTEQAAEVSIPLSEVQKMIDAAIAKNVASGDSAALIAALTKAITEKGDGKPEKFSASVYRDPEPGDQLESPVVFWASGFLYVIGDDKKNGRAIPSPLGVVVFKPNSGKRIQKGKEVNMMILSKHICQSKKELEFLRNHTMYGIRFFERVSAAETVDVRYATLISQYATGLRSMEAYRVFETARGLGITATTDDVDTMRLVLAQHYAKEAVEKSEEEFKVRIKKEKKEALALGYKDK